MNSNTKAGSNQSVTLLHPSFPRSASERDPPRAPLLAAVADMPAQHHHHRLHQRLVQELLAHLHPRRPLPRRGRLAERRLQRRRRVERPHGKDLVQGRRRAGL